MCVCGCESECGGSYSMVAAANQYYNNYCLYSTRKNVMKFENLGCKSYYPELFSFYSILLLHDLNGKMFFDDTSLPLPLGCPTALSSSRESDLN